jgi:hypothetical protein
VAGVRKLPSPFPLLSVAGITPSTTSCSSPISRITTAPIEAGNQLAEYLTFRYSGHRDQSFSVIVIVGSENTGTDDLLAPLTVIRRAKNAIIATLASVIVYLHNTHEKPLHNGG